MGSVKKKKEKRVFMIKHLSILSLIVFTCFWGNAGNTTNESFYSDYSNYSPALRNSLKFDYDQLSGKKQIADDNYSDDFNLPSLRPHWLFKTDERNWTLKERPGFLRLKAVGHKSVKEIECNNTFSQPVKFNSSGEAVSLIDLSNLSDGAEVGLYYRNGNINYIGIVNENGVSRLKVQINGDVEAGPEITVSTIMLKVKVTTTKIYFEFSLDGFNFVRLGDEFKLNALTGSDDLIGLFCVNPVSGTGWIDVDWFYFLPVSNAEIRFAEAY